jgi:hypothetical protein
MPSRLGDVDRRNWGTGMGADMKIFLTVIGLLVLALIVGGALHW